MPKTPKSQTQHSDTVKKEDGIVRFLAMASSFNFNGMRISPSFSDFLPIFLLQICFSFSFLLPILMNLFVFRFFFSGDCFGDMGFHELAMSLVDRPPRRTFFRTNNGGYASETTTEEKKEATNPLPSSVVSSSTSGTESFLEIAVYMHSFHNLDLFQQGYVSFLVLFALFKLHFNIDLW